MLKFVGGNPSLSMELDETVLGSDECCVLEYLKTWPGEFVGERQIARRADNRNRFVTEPIWARNALTQLVMLGFIETDSAGHYRVKESRNTAQHAATKFMAPHMREILMKSGRNFDLSNYSS